MRGINERKIESPLNKYTNNALLIIVLLSEHMKHIITIILNPVNK